MLKKASFNEKSGNMWSVLHTVYLQSTLSQGWSDHQAMSAPAVDTEHVLSYLPLWLFQVPLKIKQKKKLNKSQKDGNTSPGHLKI